MLSMPLLYILPLLLTPLIPVSVQSQDALIDVSVNCSQLAVTNSSEVTVKADRDIKITLLCKDAIKTYYLLNNNVKLTIPIHRFANDEVINNYSRSEPVNDNQNSTDNDGNDDNNSNKTIDNQPESNTDTCVFRSVSNEEIYGIQMTVSRIQGQNSDLTMRNYILSCTLNEYGVAKSMEIPVTKDMSAVEALEQFMGKKVSLDIQLKLYDILDQPILSPVPIQKKVRLIGKSKNNVTGLLTNNCVAKSDKNTQYRILKAGCGDGFIFHSDDGFTTDGSTITSPFFRMFKLMNSDRLTFQCTFTICNGHCDGNSCLKQRFKRDAPQLSGDLFNVDDDPDAADNETTEAMTSTYDLQQET
ncbi:uncharacterized protein LOC115225430 [Octopus sinensis]|uniref:Uncharacterized protein LOC115225430 n=1 Tax=Octopus sinensis TaxID=2607531 RepID=A0A6P7TTN0_9MOLL|nr:uncharacterized protein LOC115225430 [Octopus sinensis]